MGSPYWIFAGNCRSTQSLKTRKHIFLRSIIHQSSASTPIFITTTQIKKKNIKINKNQIIDINLFSMTSPTNIEPRDPVTLRMAGTRLKALKFSLVNVTERQT